MRKFSLFLLLCGLVLCLAACGTKNTTPDDDDIVGDDWRTWGIIRTPVPWPVAARASTCASA